MKQTVIIQTVFFMLLFQVQLNGQNVGIGTQSPSSKLDVNGSTEVNGLLQLKGPLADIVFDNDQNSLRFSNVSGDNEPMIQLFTSGTNNGTRMFVAHSPSYPGWGIQYNDTLDAFNWIGDNLPVFHIQLSGGKRVGVGTFTPEAKMHVVTNSATGFGHLKLTESQFDYARITMNNDIHPNFWDIAARTDTNLANAQLNFYHSNTGDIVSINARGRMGINDPSPAYTVEINGNESTRIINAYNNLPSTSITTYNYGLRVNLAQQSNTGFPRLYNFYGISTDSDAYLTYGLYGYASGASSNNYGVYAYAPTSAGYAGYFNGNTYATGAYLTSDPKFKTNMIPIDDGLEIVMALKPLTYQFRRNEFEIMNLPEGRHYGVSSKDIKQVLPDQVKRSFQAYDEALSDTEEGQGIWFDAVNYTELIPILISAVQEQQKTIEALQNEIEILKNK
jgi:hypothetical protein